MKGLTVLAIAVHLVTVEGSKIIQENLDYEQLDDYGRDYISADRRDTITAWKSLDEIRDMGIIEDALPEKRKHTAKCEGSTCKLCFHGLCLGLTHKPGQRQYHLHLAYHDRILYEKYIDEKEHTICKTVTMLKMPVNGCLHLKRLEIVGDQVCTSGSVTVWKYTKTIDRMCM